MILRLDLKSSVPIFEQIVYQIKYAVARGAYRPGELLPSVRQLALDALVNPNTVAKAYRDLEREGIVRTRKGLGVFVAEGAHPLCSRDGRQAVNERLRETVAEAAQAAIPRPEVEEMFAKHVKAIYRKDARK